MSQLYFDFMMKKLEHNQIIPPEANTDPAYFSFGILNFEFVGDSLCDGIEEFALKLPPQTIIIAS